LFETFFFQRRIELDTLKMDIGLQLSTLYFCPILKREFSRRILENTRISNFMKIRQVERCSVRTDMKLKFASGNFANAPNKMDSPTSCFGPFRVHRSGMPLQLANN
jgi:hypothetical protein